MHMSKDYYLFENESGKTSYLAGVVDVLSDNLTMLCDFGYAFEADIFFVENNDFSLLNNSIKKRLNAYNPFYGNNISKNDIDDLDFKLKAVDCDIKKYLYDVFSRYSGSKDLHEKTDEFLRSLNWYLQKSVCIYVPDKESSTRIYDILGNIYLYMAFEYFFIAFDEYVVLLIFGTVE